MVENGNKVYIAIDLKSFYASVECIERGLDPMKTNLVVADGERTEKTICLAVTPSLKSYGISGRARLFEVVQRIREVNADRRMLAPGRRFKGASSDHDELRRDPGLSVDYIVASPRMANYMTWSARIYGIYLRHIAPEDIHVYSIDEVFIDATSYLKSYKLDARGFTRMLLREVLNETGITATAGIGTNMYLCKVAMDIVAKHASPDRYGARIAELDETSYRRLLWDHRPLTDFWRVGSGYRKKLEANGLYTMGDIARCSVGDVHSYYNEGLLYKLFGVNAELLIDHAWGYESCTIADIKAYRPSENSISSGQVLKTPYDSKSARLIVREMTDLLSLDLVAKRAVTDQLVLTVGYDVENLLDPVRARAYKGAVTTDRYGRRIPKHAHGTIHLKSYTASTKQLLASVTELYDRIINKDLTVRRINVTACRVIPEKEVESRVPDTGEQMSMFTDYDALDREREKEKADLERERKMQNAIIEIKKKYGKNAILRGMNLEEGATAKERNRQIGGHKA